MTESTPSDLRARIQSALGSSYTVEREIGGGGMGRVFVVRDETLGRRIVAKVLSPDAAADVSIERFKREIQFAAQLQHANIVPLLTAGEAGGFPYYVMPFIDGESLRGRLSRGDRLPITEVVSLLKDVARALAYAHERGVVHRDIKPENVMVSGGAAVVTDFGIAKALSVARTGDGSSGTLTSVGTSIGTPAYMAPEQATADPATDHRADIYSFGCLAYELIAGKLPFPKGPAHALIAAHLTESPAPLSGHRTDCPPALAALVMRCLEKEPAQRPQTAREIVEQLDSVATPTGPTRLPFALSGTRGRWLVGASAALGAVTAMALFTGRSGTTSDVQLLTVLPFVAIGGDSAQAYLADGMSDELATALGKTRGVRVVGRTAANRFRGQRDVDVRAVGEALGVGLVVQGTLMRSEGGLRVNAHMSDARTGEELWSDGYQRRPDDVLAVRDEITRGIIGALREKYGGGVGARPSAETRGSANAEAYDYYLRGQFFLRRRAVPQAAQYFERAIERDQEFARAHAGLSASLAMFPYFTGTAPSIVRERLVRAAERALALDSMLAEAHTSLALEYMHSGDWERSHREHRLAVALEPEDHSAHLQYGRFLFYLGMTDSALAEFNRAKAIDPFSSLYRAWVAGALALNGDQRAADNELRQALEIDSLNAVAVQYEARFAAERGDREAALRAVRRLPAIPFWNGIAAYVYGVIGDRARADSIVRHIERQSPRPWLGETALAYAALGLRDTAAALGALERATRAGEYWPAVFPVGERIFDSVRGRDRFAGLMRQAGLPPR